MTIYFVDEDHAWFESWLLELKYLGYDVVPIPDADRALEVLRTANDVEFAIVDVMLASSEVNGTEFDLAETDGGLETGLRLLEKLVSLRPDVFPDRSCLLTNTGNDGTYLAAEQLGTDLGIELMVKSEVESPRTFAQEIQSLVEAVTG